MVSSLPWIQYSRWQPRSQVLSRQSKMQIFCALQCVLCCQYSQDRQIRFWWSFESPHPHQCGLGSNPGIDAIVGWVCHWFFPLFRGFSLGTLVFRPKNQHFQISNIQSGRHTHVSTSSWELLSAPWVNKLQHYVRMWKLLSPEGKSCGFKYIRICGTGYKDNHQRSELASWMDLVSLKA